jgi:hypothetical protein
MKNRDVIAQNGRGLTSRKGRLALRRNVGGKVVNLDKEFSFELSVQIRSQVHSD